jgi:hypothetical protein
MTVIAVNPEANRAFRELGFTVKPETNAVHYNGEETHYERIYSRVSGENEVTIWIATSDKTGKSTVNIELFKKDVLEKSSYKEFKTPKQFQTVLGIVKGFIQKSEA